MITRRFMLSAAALVPTLATVAPAHAQAKPRPVPGTDPGGPAIAIVGPGLDYRDARLVPRLARDGEGEPIGWDFVANDSRAYEAPGPDGKPGRGTRAAYLLAALAPQARLICVHENSWDPTAFGRAMSFLSQTPARIVVWLDGSPARADWKILGPAADRFRDHLIVVPASGDAKPYADAAGRPTILMVSGNDPAQALSGMTAKGPATRHIVVTGQTVTSGTSPLDGTAVTASLRVAAHAARLLARTPNAIAAQLAQTIEAMASADRTGRRTLTIAQEPPASP